MLNKSELLIEKSLRFHLFSVLTLVLVKVRYLEWNTASTGEKLVVG